MDDKGLGAVASTEHINKDGKLMLILHQQLIISSKPRIFLVTIKLTVIHGIYWSIRITPDKTTT